MPDNFVRRGQQQDYKERDRRDSNVTASSDAKNEKVEDDHLDFDLDPRSFSDDFPLVLRCVTTTKTLCGIIGQIIGSVFNDYDGCYIYPLNTGNGHVPALAVYFNINKMGGDGLYRAIEPITAGEDRNGNNRYRDRGRFGTESIIRYNSRFTTRHHKLTKQAQKIFKNYIHDSRIKFVRNFDGSLKSKDIDWNKVTAEVCDSNNVADNMRFIQQANNTLFMVNSIDLVKLMGKIYGSITEDGNRCLYKVVMGASLTPINGAENNIVIIEQVKASDAQKVMDYSGKPMFNRTVPRY